MDFVQTGGVHRVTFLAYDSSHAAVTGATVTAKIFRFSDGAYWNGTGFQAAPISVSLTETDAANLPGLYHYRLSLPSNLAADTITILITSSTGTVTSDPEVQKLFVGGFLNYISYDLGTIATSTTQIDGVVATISLIRSAFIILNQSIDGIVSAVGEIVDRVRALGGGKKKGK